MLRPTSRPVRTFQSRPLALAAMVALLLTVAGCGAAGMDGATAAGKPSPAAALATLSITTAHLPDGCEEGEYPPTQLLAAGAQGPVAWALEEGRLPGGVRLTSGGIVAGCPTAAGLYPFTVTATDGIGTDTRELVLAIDTFGVQVDGRRFGEVWSGSPITLVALCATGPVSFEAVAADSGGAFDRIDGTAGEAVWMPGWTSDVATDRIRVVDETSGASVEVTLQVLPHPAAHMVAEFGSTDVWYVDCTRRFGQHGLPRDWDQTLHALGLRSGAFVPTEADRLSDWYVRRRVLAHLNLFFGRNPDGTRGDGLAISFPFDPPPAVYSTPPPGGYANGTPERFNVISVVHDDRASIVGMAIVDDPTNPLVENDTPCEALGALGVFGNQVVRAFNGGYQNIALPADPVHAGDETGLRDLIHGRPVTGRAALIGAVADDFARVLASVLAHEIGHGLGLRHTDPTVTGAIMNGTASTWRGVDYHFTAGSLENLRYALPGPGRMQAHAAKATAHPVSVAPCATPVVWTPPQGR